MLAALALATAALAAPLQLAFSLGPAVGVGESTRGSYFSAAPATAVSLTWRLGPVESWIGASGSLLMAGSGDDVVPASLLQGEVGLGFGGKAGGGGIYGGNGFPGAILGAYAHVTVPGRGWVRRVGLEPRFFYARATDSTALALLLRIEPGRPEHSRARPSEPPPRPVGPPPRRPPPPPYPPPPPPRASSQPPAPGAPAEAPEAAPDDAPLAIPAGGATTGAPAAAPPPPDPPPAQPAPTEPAPTDSAPPASSHHDEPY